MKKLYLINKVTLIITLALYLTIIFGLLAQIILGAIQVICALLLFFYWKRISNKTKEHLYIYWTVVIIYGLCWLFDWANFKQDFIFIFGIVLIPLSIAIYFVYILRLTKNYIL